MKRVHLIISGFVQGIGYRAWIKREATKLGITGWVKNREDGEVEAICEGKPESIEALINLAKQGPLLSQINQVEVKWEASRGEYASFEIVR